MKRMLCLLMILCIGAIGALLVLAETEERGFGFGGAMAMAFFPDMSEINAFLSENGLDPMGDFLIGAGGSGRGGVIGGPSFGGIGWGLLAMSEGEDTHAELISAGGGFDLGAAVGGSEDSVLTLGVVLGAGANVLSLTSSFDEDFNADDPDNVTTCGIVPVPISRELVHVNGFVQPYVSMSAQLLSWVGFEFRLGYIFPVVGMDVGDLLGIPAPSLEMSGPTVSCGFAFGGIGSGKDIDTDKASSSDQVTIASDGSIAIASGTELVIENALGDIVISGYAVDTTELTTDLVVEWQAVRTAGKRRIDELQILSDVTELGSTLTTVGTGRIDYVLRIPAGIDLKVKNAMGNITLADYEAQTIIIENGVGEVDLQGVYATVLIVSGGIGKIDLPDVDAQTLIVELGIGEIDLELPVSASARLIAKAGIGDVTIDRFPSMTGGVHGFLGKSGNVILGHGERMIELNVGLGEIVIEMGVP